MYRCVSVRVSLLGQRAFRKPLDFQAKYAPVLQVMEISMVVNLSSLTGACVLESRGLLRDGITEKLACT